MLRYNVLFTQTRARGSSHAKYVSLPHFCRRAPDLAETPFYFIEHMFPRVDVLLRAQHSVALGIGEHVAELLISGMVGHERVVESLWCAVNGGRRDWRARNFREHARCLLFVDARFKQSKNGRDSSFVPPVPYWLKLQLRVARLRGREHPDAERANFIVRNGFHRHVLCAQRGDGVFHEARECAIPSLSLVHVSGHVTFASPASGSRRRGLAPTGLHVIMGRIESTQRGGTRARPRPR